MTFAPIRLEQGALVRLSPLSEAKLCEPLLLARRVDVAVACEALSISPEIREGVGERGDVLSGAGLMALS